MIRRLYNAVITTVLLLWDTMWWDLQSVTAVSVVHGGLVDLSGTSVLLNMQSVPNSDGRTGTANLC